MADFGISVEIAIFLNLFIYKMAKGETTTYCHKQYVFHYLCVPKPFRTECNVCLTFSKGKKP